MTKTNKKIIKVVYNNKGKFEFKEVEAEKFDEVIIDDKIINIYIHRDICNNKRWAITEEATGLLLEGNFKNKIEAKSQYEKYLKNTLIDLIKNNYSIYLKAIKNFNEILNNKINRFIVNKMRD